MNGVLYPQPEGVLMDPRSALLMQTGLGLLSASGPSRAPVPFGQALGQAGMQGMQAFQQAKQAQLQEAFRQAQMKKMEEQMALERLKALQPKTHSLSPGGMLVGPDGKVIVQAPFKPEPTPGPQSDLGRLAADLKAGLITQAQYDEKYKRLTAPSQPLVTVDNRQESEFNKKVGAEMGEQYAGLLKADMNAPATIAKYQRLGQLLSSVNTGKFKGTTVELKAAAKSFGVDLGAMGIADDVAPAQAARALSNQLALELRNPAGGAGMPGALSDKDREFLVQSIPSLENDPRAIEKMIEYRVKLAKREQQVARMARAYRKKHGKFDEGFFDEIAEFSANNPLFKGEPDKPKPVPLSPEEQKELEELRKRFKK